MWKLLIIVSIYVHSKSFTPQASYYSDYFENKLTANGEIFQQNLPTVASPYLAFGSIVSITNKANGKNVLVRVNDRGPYKEDSTGKKQPHPIRHFDLSKSAFMKIADTTTGIIDIKYDIIWEKKN